MKSKMGQAQKKQEKTDTKCLEASIRRGERHPPRDMFREGDWDNAKSSGLLCGRILLITFAIARAIKIASTNELW